MASTDDDVQHLIISVEKLAHCRVEAFTTEGEKLINVKEALKKLQEKEGELGRRKDELEEINVELMKKNEALVEKLDKTAEEFDTKLAKMAEELEKKLANTTEELTKKNDELAATLVDDYG
jgi:DNA anti-recombination protein RmuC